MSTPVTVLIRDAAEVLTLRGPAPDPARPAGEAPLAVIEGGSVAFSGDRVVAIGPTREVLDHIAIDPARTIVIDAKGCVVAPGLIDAHTHALFVGHRADEFVGRIEGASYADIAARGGGIELRACVHR